MKPRRAEVFLLALILLAIAAALYFAISSASLLMRYHHPEVEHPAAVLNLAAAGLNIDPVAGAAFLIVAVWGIALMIEAIRRDRVLSSSRRGAVRSSAPRQKPDAPEGGPLPPAGRPPVFVVHLGPHEVLAIEEDAIEQARRRPPCGD